MEEYMTDKSNKIGIITYHRPINYGAILQAMHFRKDKRVWC